MNRLLGLLGVFAVLATTLLAYPLALVFRASGPRVQRLLIFIILMPLLTSVVIRTFAWIVILAREGVLNQTLMGLGLTATPLNLLQTELGLVIALTQIEMPLMLLPLSAVGAETSGGRNPAPAGTGREAGGVKRAPEANVEYEFLPEAAGILEELVPAAFKARLFKCFLDAAVSEQIARRVAMKAATENAGDLIKDITRVYNRTRQANITKEISELIAGSEALK